MIDCMAVVCNSFGMKQHPITAFRKERGLTQGQLADLVGLSRWTVNQIEMGKRRPSWRSLDKWVSVTGIPRQELRPDIYGSTP